ncbi:unnamed protein product [[Actinomadura] parvosata subsp. kistnae]|nr:unnamed protein product [Actinomadura parvosata subsp. kistnae]
MAQRRQRPARHRLRARRQRRPRWQRATRRDGTSRRHGSAGWHGSARWHGTHRLHRLMGERGHGHSTFGWLNPTCRTYRDGRSGKKVFQVTGGLSRQ